MQHFLIVCMGLPRLASCQTAQGQGHQEALAPDKITRLKASQIAPAQAASLRVYGVQYMRFADNPIQIRDRKRIAAFLHALRYAEGLPSYQNGKKNVGLANRVDTLEVHFKKTGRHVRAPEVFDFNLDRPEDCFGAEFQKLAAALRKRHVIAAVRQ